MLPAPAPVINSTTAEFWKATTEGRFILQRCDACDIVLWFPRRNCPKCWTEDVSTFDAQQTGTVYSFTVVRKGKGAFQNAGPFVIAYVELADGPRIMTNIVDCDIDALHVGMPVEMVFHDTGEGSALYRFRPLSA
ncbi:MAG: nucleotide-binding protein [Ilumatobacteraceae bacterium]|nr:nucleotide-binding protein [Ilumatobacteraceae bacterium]